MADESPRKSAFPARSHGSRWALDAANAANGGGLFQREVSSADVERHLQHEVAVCTERIDGELPQFAPVGRLFRIDNRDINLAADVAGPRTGLLL